MQVSAKSNSFLIVGGGVIGLSLAWELAKRGQSVTLVRSGSAELRSASWAGAGILPPVAIKNIDDPYDQLRSLSHELHHQWASELLSLTGIDTGFRKCGGVYLGTSRAEVATLTANQFWWEDHGIEFRKLDIAELRALEHSLSCESNTIGAWLLPDECQLRNPRHLKALEAACQSRGVQFVEATVDRVELSPQGRATLYDPAGQAYTAEHICLCNGAWARMLMQQVELENGIMPVRGQLLLYQCESPPIRHIINDGHRYLVARSDGMLLAGSVEEEAGYNCHTTDEAINLIRQWAEATLPMLQHTPLVRSWAGLRPGSYDGLPYMGKAPGSNNLYVAAGHFRSGLHMSCGTAVIMADLMLGQTPAIDITAFRVGRG